MALLDGRNLTAYEQQQELCGFFGFRNQIIWDSYPENDKEALVRKIKLIIADNGADNKVAAQIVKIVESVWNQRKYNGGNLLMVPIFIVCVNKEYPENADISEAKTEKKFSLHPVFRIRKCVKQNDSENCCMIFVDETARVYNTWESYIECNNLPAGVMVAPRKGVYVTETDTNRIIVSLFRTPASSSGVKFIGGADIGTTIAGLGSSLVLIGSIFAPIVLAPAIVPAVVVGAGCGAYSIVRSSWSLFDKSKHEQSISLTDAEARSNWFGIVGGAAGMAAGGIAKGVAYMAANGQEVGMAMRAAANLANATAMAANGCGVVNGFVGVFLRYRDDESITALDCVQLSASLFLFTHSVYNFQTANKLIESTQNRTINGARENLSRNQKRAFDKLTKETIRTRGGVIGKNDVIRGLNNIPDHNEFFRDLYKMNKELNRNNVRVAFDKNGGMIQMNNGGEGYIPGQVRQNLRVQPAAAVFENVPRTPGITVANPNYEINLTNSNGLIDPARVSAMIGVISQLFTVCSEGDLRNNILNFTSIMTERAFRIFMEILDSFVTDFRDIIQTRLNRIIPYEQIMYDALQALYGAVKERLNEYLEEIWENNRQVPINLLQVYYYNMRDSADVNTLCKICGGSYFS